MTDDGMLTLGDFTRLPGRFQSLSMVPQWDFLDFITAEAERSPTFTLRCRAEVIALIEQGRAVRGALPAPGAATATGERQLRALLTVAADGRHSTVRRAAGLATVGVVTARRVGQ